MTRRIASSFAPGCSGSSAPDAVLHRSYVAVFVLLALVALITSVLPGAVRAQSLPTLSAAVVEKPRVSDTGNFISVDEEVGTVEFTVTLSAASTDTVTVGYATEDIPVGDQVFTDVSDAFPAIAGEDYTATSGRLIFAPGETSKTVSVRIIDEPLFEPAQELFRVVLSDPSGATVAAGQGGCSSVSSTAIRCRPYRSWWRAWRAPVCRGRQGVLRKGS